MSRRIELLEKFATLGVRTSCVVACFVLCAARAAAAEPLLLVQASSGMKPNDSKAADDRQRELQRQEAQRRAAERRDGGRRAAGSITSSPPRLFRRNPIQSSAAGTTSNPSPGSSMQPSAAGEDRSRLLDIRRRARKSKRYRLQERQGQPCRRRQRSRNAASGHTAIRHKEIVAERRRFRTLGGPGVATGDDQRSRISDVRKRLGGQGRNDAAKATNPPKLSEDLNLVGPPPADRRSSGAGRLNVGGEQRLRPLPSQSAALSREASKINVSDRLKTGNLHHVTTGETATKLKLADQYTMWGQGDVARRLDLQRHVHDLGVAGAIRPSRRIAMAFWTVRTCISTTRISITGW